MIASDASSAALNLASLETVIKNKALLAVAEAVDMNREKIIQANLIDLKSAREYGKNNAFLSKLALSDEMITEMIQGLKTVANLPDPIGKVIEEWTQKDKLQIKKISVPIGVILVIYESRPNVTIDAAALCLKSGNAVILKGGSEAQNTNLALANIFIKTCNLNGIPLNSIQIATRSDINLLLTQNNYINLVIPRGGKNLIQMIINHSKIPILKHLDGVCNLYIDNDADIEMAIKITINSKCQRPGVCNAIENLIIHHDIAHEFLPKVSKLLIENDVKLVGDPASIAIVGEDKMQPATDKDWQTEYLDLMLSIKLVYDIDEAIIFINKYGSKHSDGIVTNNNPNAEKFMDMVDSANIFHNASTRFSDGFQYGFGAEIGISTDKLHARGPVGLKELTTYKYLILGDGQLRK